MPHMIVDFNLHEELQCYCVKIVSVLAERSHWRVFALTFIYFSKIIVKIFKLNIIALLLYV